MSSVPPSSSSEEQLWKLHLPRPLSSHGDDLLPSSSPALIRALQQLHHPHPPPAERLSQARSKLDGHSSIGLGFSEQSKPHKESEDSEVSGLASVASVSFNSPSLKVEEEGHVNSSRGVLRSSPIALTAQGAVGAGAAKVNKRRSRAASKSPITVLSADTTNFRAMVQKLTGIPTSPSIHRNGFQFLGSPAMSVLKPHPSRPSQSFQGLPTLDTSAFLLVDGTSGLSQSQNILQNFANYPLLQSSRQLSDSSLDANLAAKLGLNRPGDQLNSNNLAAGAASDLKSFLPNFMGNPSNLATSRASLPSLWDPAEMDKFKGKCLTDRLKDNAFNEGKFGDNSKHVSYQGMVREADQFGLQM